MKTFLRDLAFAVTPLVSLAPGSSAAAQSAARNDTAFVAPIEIVSKGVTLRGTVYVAAGREPHATVIHLQGFPGGTSTDFEQYLQSKGFNAVFVHVRGQQTSDGLYTVAGMADDAGAAVAFLRRDSVSRALRINPQRITLVGGSAGTLGALRATAADPTLRCVAAIVPFNWTLAGLAARRDSTMLRGYRATIANLTKRPQPPIRTDSDFVTAIVRDAESYDLRVVAGSLRDRNVYLVGAQNDETAPLMEHFYPLVQAARAAPAAMVRDTIVSDGHSLTSPFTAVFAATSRWLREYCSS